LISRENLGRDPATGVDRSHQPGRLSIKDLLIAGGREPETLPAPPGTIRAYGPPRTGQIAWSFHAIPHPGEFGYDTWRE